jgi:acyl dehydratase
MADRHEKAFFEDLTPGTEVPPATYGPTDRTAYITTAIILRDGNPLHLDRVYAHDRGLPDVVPQGPLNPSYLHRSLTDWLHRPWDLCRTKMFVANVFNEHVLSGHGTVLSTYRKAGEPWVDCRVWQENQKGEKTLIGEATFTLPQQNK